MRLSIEYIAGFFDADGCVSSHFQPQANRAWVPALGIDVTFDNQDLSVLEDIMETFGCGKIELRRNNTGSGCYHITFSRRDTKRILEMLIPHLRIKREVAKLALMGLNTINPKRGGRGIGRIRPEEIEFRKMVVEKMSEMNHANGKAFRTKWVKSVEPSTANVVDETMPSQAATGTEGDLKVLRKV
jgi:LAGLIDADG endonuclease